MVRFFKSDAKETFCRKGFLISKILYIKTSSSPEKSKPFFCLLERKKDILEGIIPFYGCLCMDFFDMVFERCFLLALPAVN